MIRPNAEVITPPTASPFPPWSFTIATIPSTREVTANALIGLFPFR